jgi:pyrimidine operon attenuation protein / uracil phosphoribosyltransferase
MRKITILNSTQFQISLMRLTHQLIENHGDFNNTVIIGLQPRGIFLMNRLVKLIEEATRVRPLHGAMDITFHRDDFRRSDSPIVPSTTEIDFIIEGKNVVLIDDVLFTGRTVRAGLDAMLTFGRPKAVELLVLIDRRFSRQLPIQPEYVGKYVDTIKEERVSVEWNEIDKKDQVILFTPKE